MKEVVIVIPAYEPNNLLIGTIENINQVLSFPKIVIVDDGSINADETFEKVKSYENVILIKHEINKGKGMALKTAFHAIHQWNGEYLVVTCDADGQHKAEDIKKVIEHYNTLNKGVVLGSRILEKDVPLRSRFGNGATRFLYRLTNNRKIYDNQTGLRAFGSDLLPFMCNVKGERYEYEMNMLIECNRYDISISEVKIEAVYIDNNSSSHFRPVKDFIKICGHILKYAIPAIITLFIDIIIFLATYYHLADVGLSDKLVMLLSCFTGVLVSFLTNMVLHRFNIFNGNKMVFKIIKKRNLYFLISLGIIVTNTLSTYGLFMLIDNIINAKIFAEIEVSLITLILNYLFVPKVKLN